MLCRLPSDSDNEGGRGTRRRRHARDVIRLDKFLENFKAKHKENVPSEGRSLLDIGFTRHTSGSPPLSHDAVMGSEEEGGLITATHHHEYVATRAMQPPPRQVASTPIPHATAETETM